MKPATNINVLYIADIALIIGQSNRNARRLYHRIRKAYNRPSMNFISVEDFTAFTGISEEKIQRILH